MENKRNASLDGTNGNLLKYSVKIAIALFCLSLIMSGPYAPLPHDGSLGAPSVLAAPGDAQPEEATDTETDDTPNEDDIADFASEYDKDGDGEVDEPEDEADDEPSDEPDDVEDEGDQQDDRGSDYDDDQDDERDDDHDGQENLEDDDESGDAADTREDVDGEASPDYRISGFNRYPLDEKRRYLGDFSGLTPLIEREETLLFEN